MTHNTITGAADNALFCNDSRGLVIAANMIAKSGNGGIRVFQSDKRYDGALIADNRIEDTAARAGGSGENGNAINVFRAGDVIVRGNHIRNAAFSAIRGNSASNIQILGNSCTGLDEVAIYSEFGFQGAVVADNVIDGAETGISIANFNEGGRLATVRGNIVRNLRTQRPGEAGNGISVEADTVVSGNVIEGAPLAGIAAGWGQYLRNVAITGNVVRAGGLRRRRVGGGQCRRGDDFRQCVRRHTAWRDCRHGVAQAGDRRPRACRCRALSAAQDQRQSGELTATFQPESVPI